MPIYGRRRLGITGEITLREIIRHDEIETAFRLRENPP
jgi:hypothetical protein